MPRPTHGDKPKVRLSIMVSPEVREYLMSTGNASAEVEAAFQRRLKRQKKTLKKS